MSEVCGAKEGNSLGCLQNRSVYHLAEAQGEQNPEAIAIRAPARIPLNYGRLRSFVHDTMRMLNSLGVGRNDRVAIVLPNGPEMAVAFIAVAAGATGAPLNPGYRENEFKFYLSDLKVKRLLVQSGTESPSRAAARALGIPIIELSPILEGAAGLFSLSSEDRSEAKAGGFADSDDVALVLHTSGTTSRPKMVPLTQANVCYSAQNIRRAFELGIDDCCLNVMPLFHIHGLIGATLSSLVAGASIFCTPGFDGEKFFDWLRECSPTWYTAVPTMHQAVLEGAVHHRDAIADCPLRFVRSCSSFLPPKLMAELEDVLGVPVIESYGMTEASHQMTSNPLPPRERKAGSVGLASGCKVAIMDEVGKLSRPGEVGEIVIRGANVMRGYDDNPGANKRAFTNGWFRTGDQGYLDPDGYLFITGRLKEMINRGGEKISPREVDEVLMDHPAVAKAVTFAVPHPKLGEDVVAAVVLRENATATARELRGFAFGRLSREKAPSQVLLVEKIPTGPTGKLQRVGLADQLASELKAEFMPPRNEIERTLSGIWTEVLGLEQVGVYDNFFILGGDSLMAVRVVSRLNMAFDVELKITAIFEDPTVVDLAMVIEEMLMKTGKVDHQEAARILAELEELPDEEAQRILDEEMEQFSRSRSVVQVK